MPKYYSEKISFQLTGKNNAKNQEIYYFIFKKEGDIYKTSLIDLADVVDLKQMGNTLGGIRGKLMPSLALSEDEKRLIYTTGADVEHQVKSYRRDRGRYGLMIHQDIAHKFNFMIAGKSFKQQNLNRLIKYRGHGQNIQDINIDDHHEEEGKQGKQTMLIPSDNQPNLSTPPRDVLPKSLHLLPYFFAQSSLSTCSTSSENSSSDCLGYCG